MMTEKFPEINFIGNKVKIADWICDHIPADAKSFFDAFSGSSSVGYEAKKRGLRVISNDVLKINYLLAKSLIENNHEILDDQDIRLIFSGKPYKGFIYKKYANKIFYPEECMELDLYRKNIKKLPSAYKQALALVLLRRSMIRKMPYSRFNIEWGKVKQLRDEEYSYQKYKRKRAYHNKSIKYHFLENLPNYNKAIFNNKKRNLTFNADIFSLLAKVKADVIYLDPPYTGTMNDYFAFYGILDEYTDSKDKKPFKNNFTNKEESLVLFDKLFSKLSNYKYWMLSFNNNSYPKKTDLLDLLGKYAKDVKVFERKHTYKITGKRNKNQNTEYLFLVRNKKYD